MYRLENVAGVDEVGRGPLAGAVIAAAVVLNPFKTIGGLRDSKKLSLKKRLELDVIIREQAIAYAIGRAEVAEIDALNILNASLLAMQRAVNKLSIEVDFALVDGNRTPELPCASEWLIKGDNKHDSIKAASIIAKVARDKEMQDLDLKYPQYGLAKHKGYPTAHHLLMLEQHGPSQIHRMSFAPCRRFVTG
ncbi:MAG: ribonuclease HII [Pseudomonadales bacterium]|nr:ribonuclease HII [Pseudomonadales bacterium]